MLLRLIEPDAGELRFEARDLLALRGETLRTQRCQMQMIFQDPFASLNPRMCVGEIVAEPLAIHEPTLSAAQRTERMAAIMSRDGLNADAMRAGQFLEVGPAEQVLHQPTNAYTLELLSAAPELPAV